MTADGKPEDLIGKVGRCIAVLRDGLLTGLIVVGIVILWTLWPDLQKQLQSSSVESITLGAVSLKLNVEKVASFQSTNLTMEAVGGSADVLEKGSQETLAAAERQGAGRIDLIGVSSGGTYTGDLLLAYITRLAPKYVIFRNAGKLEGWISAGVLAVQLTNHDSYPYDRLVSTIHGLRKESINKTASARDALDEMQKLHLDHLPAVDDDHRFQFMLSRDEILAKVITSVVLTAKR